jgi:prepilin-type N-terminal cleavage/methylation domain-containing protein
MGLIKGDYPAFTLIELLVVIAILGILAGVAGPNLTGWTCRQNVKNDFAELNGFLSTLRSEAINQNRSIMAYVEREGVNALISTRVGPQGEKKSCDTTSIIGAGIAETFTTDGSKLEDVPISCFHADGTADRGEGNYIITRQCGGVEYKYKNQILEATGFIQEFKWDVATDQWWEM